MPANPMQIRILKPGMLSTLQDMGRQNYLPDAVPVSGAMDTLSARIVNKAVGNADNDAVIEFTYAGAAFITDTDVLIAYSGGGALLYSDGVPIPVDRPVFIPAQTVLSFRHQPSGSRAYLAVAGGWDVPMVLGSRSTYITAGFGGLEGRALKTGDVLHSTTHLTWLAAKILAELKGADIKYPHWSLARHLLLAPDQKTIRIVPAREFTWFTAASIIDFLSQPYALSPNSNRMGYHMEGAAIHRANHAELLSTAVVPGTIQVTGSGSMILLMADCQTTGGYPRIAQVAAVDLSLCGQLKPGDIIYFNEISSRDAEKLYLELETQLHRLTVAIGTKFQ